MDKKTKVTAIGGIFFKAKNPRKIKDWYKENLGIIMDDYGALFEFRDKNNPEKSNIYDGQFLMKILPISILPVKIL